jgi:Na+-translocating ferredoxin:NAD+ oxidoreductase RnfA subunit
MKPSTILFGILLGSVGAVAFGLVAVLVIFALLQDREPRAAAEIPELVRGAILFTVLTGVAIPAFLGSLRGAPWRRWPMGLLFLGFAGIGWYYWAG